MAKKPVLVVMAAGMGSRYGGLKQIDPVGSCGEAILDYSVYDACRAGFETVVIIIKEAIKKDDYGLGTVDFNKIIPMPKELDIVCGSSTDRGLKAYKELAEIYQFGVVRTKEELLNIPEESEKAFLKHKKDIKPEDWENGRQAFRNILQYGYPTWYEWSCNNWGTKWSSCGYEEGQDYNVEPNKLWFQTAWSAPHPILQKLSEQYPDIRFTHE